MDNKLSEIIKDKKVMLALMLLCKIICHQMLIHQKNNSILREILKILYLRLLFHLIKTYINIFKLLEVLFLLNQILFSCSLNAYFVVILNLQKDNNSLYKEKLDYHIILKLKKY
jgi:hypothetical protein